ncbi:MAG: PQQ-binding-like beta-propeller repeat protein [Thermoplasmata archaeon]
MTRWTVICMVALALAATSYVVGPGPAAAAPAAAMEFAPTLGHFAPALQPSGPWPTYMSDPERTSANHRERAIDSSDVGELRPIWSLSNNGSDFSAPIVVNGTLFYGSWNGNETAVNVTTGAIEWTRYLGTDPSCGGYTPMGISSTAAYLDGTIYVGGGDGYWYALNASTGATEWRYLVGTGADAFYDWASALVYHGSLYIGIASCFDNPLIPAGLIELNLTGPHTPSHVFHSTPVGSAGESIWTTPALDPANNTLWVATGNENPPGYPRYANAIVGLNATTLNVSGSWQVPNVAGQDADFGSTPVLFFTHSGTPMVVATDKNGIAYALDRANVSVNGTWGPTWNLSTGGGFSGAAFDGHTLYLAGGGSVEAVVPGNGSVLWSAGMDGGGEILGSLGWADGVVFAAGGSEVEAINSTNGTVLWNATFPDGGSGVTEPVVADGVLFVASGDYGTEGSLTAYGLANASYHSVTFVETGLPAGKTWSAGLGGSTVVTTHGSATFYEPNGTFAYLLRGPSGYRVVGFAPAGTLTVSGSNVTDPIQFIRGSTVTMVFHEAGLIPGDNWCVLFGSLHCAIKPTITLKGVTPGSYSYDIDQAPGYSLMVRAHHVVVGDSGTVDLTLRGATLDATFAPRLYPVVFEETGLAASVHWHVRGACLVPKRAKSGCFGMSAAAGGTGLALALNLRNGSYSWAVVPIHDYELEVDSVTGWTGTMQVSGSAQYLNFTFVRT